MGIHFRNYTPEEANANTKEWELVLFFALGITVTLVMLLIFRGGGII